MTELAAPPDPETVAVAGAVSTMEEALQAHQMRFILAWAMRLEEVAEVAKMPPPAQAPRSASWPPM